MATEVADDMAGSGQPRAAILLVVGEPFSDRSKEQIVEEIAKGLKRWDSEASGVDLAGELAQMAAKANLGEEHPTGERVVHYRSDKAIVEVLINPQAQMVKDSLKVLLTTPCPAKALIYAGYVFQGNAAWVMQDDLFSFSMFCQAFKDTNVENALKRTEGGSLILSTLRGCDWTAALKGSDLNKLLKVSVNPAVKTDDGPALAQFSAYVRNLVRVTPLTSMLQASDVIGNISFSRPVLYIFPSHQGDAALFGMKGFNMLVDGGYSRRPCFWDFVRHLDGIDALLLTHLGADNLFGLKALLERKVTDSVHPDIDYMYMNAARMGSNGVKAVGQGETGGSDLVISLAAEGSTLVDMSRKLGHAPHPLTRPLSSNLEPVNLFHKIGKGSLDMYILNPVGDAKETKEFLAEWGKQAPSFSQVNGIPIPNCSSICALLVVRPASSMEKVTRILFPGTAPQHKLLEGLERVKHLEFLKHPTFCNHDLHKAKKAAAAAMANGRASSVTRRTASATAARSATRAEPPRHLDTKGASPRSNLTSPASGRSSKLQKDSSNKRVSGATKDKAKQDAKEKEDKTKSSTSSSPSKASIKTISPVKSPSPARTPASTTPEERPKAAEKTPAPTPKPSGDGDKPPAVSQKTDLDQHITPADSAATLNAPPAKVETTPADDNMAASPEELPDPSQFGSDVDFGRQQPPSTLIGDQAKLRELGIYDNEDDDEGVDNRYDEKENGGIFGARDFSEEEVQPQALPEPVAALETPSSEPDIMPDAFSKTSLMEQSQLFEHGIEPDYGTEGEVSVTESQMEKETASSVAMSEPLDVHSSALSGPSADLASVDQYQALDSAVSDSHTEDSLLAEQPTVESSPMSDHPAEKIAESPLMTQDLPEDSYPAAEPEVEKTTFTEEPHGEPASLMQESMVEDSALPVQSQMGDFAPQSTFPSETDALKQEPEDDHLAGDVDGIPPPKLDDDLGPVCSEYPEDSKEVAPQADFREEPEPALSDDDDEIKEAPLQNDVKKEMTPDLSDEEETEPTPAAVGLDDLREPSPLAAEPQQSTGETDLEPPAQSFDHGIIEADAQLTPACLGTLQAPSPGQPELSDSLQDFSQEMQNDTGISPREASPAFQESDAEDGLKESHSALEEPSFEDSLKEASPMTDGSLIHDDLRGASPPLQPAQSDLGAAPAALEPSIDGLREASPPAQEAGFDTNEREAGQSVEEPAIDFKEREASPALEEPGFDLEEKEMIPPQDFERDESPAVEEPSFGAKDREASPVTAEEQEAHPQLHDFEREESPAMREQGFDMEAREPSPALREPDFEMKATEERQTFAEQSYDLEEKEGSPALERTNVDDVMETGFEPLKEGEARPDLEEPKFDAEKEASPALEEPGYDIQKKEASPVLEEPVHDMDREASPVLEEPVHDMDREASPVLEEPVHDMDREASPVLEEPGHDLEKEASVVLEEPSYGMGKEASPALEEPGYDMDKEASPALEEPGYDMDKEASPALEDPGYGMKKEASPALEDPGYGMEKEASPTLEEPGHNLDKEASPALIEPGYDIKKEASPALEDPGYDIEKEASPALDKPGYDLEKEASPALDKPGYDLEKEASPALEKPGYGLEKEASPALEEPGYDSEKEASPALEKPGYDLEKEASPALAEPSYEAGKEAVPAPLDEPSHDSEKEASPSLDEPGYDVGKEASLAAMEEPGFDAKAREDSPVLEEFQHQDEMKGLNAPPAALASGDHFQECTETDFTSKEEASELSAGRTEQTLQYDHVKDQGLEMKNAQEEEEEEEEDFEEKEEVLKKEGVTELKQGFGARDEEEDEELDADDKAQAEIMTRQTMEDMEVADDDGQDDDEETAEAVDSGDNDNDDFAYERDLNIPEDKIAATGAASQDQLMDTDQTPHLKPLVAEAKQDQQMSDIPAEEDDGLATHPMKEEYKESAGGEERKLPESYGMEGDLMDGDRDMQEIMAMQQSHKLAHLAQEEDSDLECQEPEPREEPAMNPFTGVREQPGHTKSAQPYAYDDDEEGGHRAAPGEFDPLAQWGPPTGLPAPAPQFDDVDAVPEPHSDLESLKSGEFGEQGEGVRGPESYEDLGVKSKPENLAEGDVASKVPHFEKGASAADRSSEVDAAEFDPLAEWGQPMGLPAPAPPKASNKNLSAKKGDAKKSDAKKPAASPTTGKPASDKRPASATKPSPKAMNGTPETPKSSRPKPEARKEATRSSRPTSGRNLDTSRNDPKTRTTPTTRRPASSTRSRVSPDVIKMPPLPPFTPFYMDLTYIPNHGDTNYVDTEFFKRVRARYYVLSSRNPNPKVLEMLMEAKESWGKSSEQEVTVIPTYETQILQHWMAVHKEKLAENKIDIAPAASRCTVRLQDHEDSCYTYRLEF